MFHSFLLALALQVQDTYERWDPLMVRFDLSLLIKKASASIEEPHTQGSGQGETG
jgi:hypothetical protein